MEESNPSQSDPEPAAIEHSDAERVTGDEAAGGNQADSETEGEEGSAADEEQE